MRKPGHTMSRPQRSVARCIPEFMGNGCPPVLMSKRKVAGTTRLRAAAHRASKCVSINV